MNLFHFSIKTIHRLTLLGFLFIVYTSNAQTLNGAGSFEGIGNNKPNAILSDAAGYIYITGAFNGTVDFDAGNNQTLLTGNDDAYLCKYDPSGQLLWVRQWGSGGVDESVEICLNSFGFLILSGNFTGTVDFDPSANDFMLSSAGNQDVFISSFDTSGNFQFALSFGGSNMETVTSMIISQNQQLLLGGYFSGSCDFDPGPSANILTAQGAGDGFIVALTPLGNFLWADAFGGNDNFAVDEVNGITENTNGDLFVCGYFSSNIDLDPSPSIVAKVSMGLFDFFAVRLSATNVYEDGIALGGTGMDLASAITNQALGNIIISGSFENNVDFDPQIASLPKTSNGMSDAFWLCLDENFNFLWMNQIGGIENDEAGNIWCDGLGNVYSGGNFSNQSDLDPGAGINNKTSNGFYDFFATVFDPLGNSLGAYTIGGPLNDVFYDLAKGPGNSFYYCGTFRDTMDADADPNNFYLLNTPNQAVNSFLLSLERCLQPDLPLLSLSSLQVCEGSAVNIEIVSGDLNDASDWTWYEDNCGGNAFATGLSQFIYPTQSMNIYVRGEGGCVSTGNCNSVFLEVLPAPIISLGNDTTICINDFLFLQADSIYSSYLWSTGDTTHSIYLLASNYPVGLQAITLAVTDSLGCVGMDEILIDITICAKTETKKMVHENFVFPNPANNFIQLKNYATSNVQLWKIYGADGKLIKTFNTQSDYENTFVCDVSWLSNGLYFLKNQDGEIFRFTVIR
jgi:hypothetical protein